MTPQQLKNSILQLAIQGKLVEQRPEEGTAEDLYRDIQAEKARLVNPGKIKKDKPLPEIADDELPFDIPENWRWARLRQLGFTQTGNTPARSRPEYRGNDIPFINPGDIQGGAIAYDNQALSKLGEEVARTAQTGTILQVCIGGLIGKAAICDREVAFNQQINALTPIICSSKFLYAVMQSQYFIGSMKKKTGGTATPIINRGLWDSLLLPLPPLAEQKRIVARIEELLPLVDRYEQAWTQLQALDQRFPADLQKSILQLAIQGRLVEQRPEEGTAEALYREILAEKARLVKEGKIKKDKPLPEIADDELPFDIPESWRWCYIGDLFQHNTGKALNSSNKDGSLLTYITTSNLYWNRFELGELRKMPFTESEVDKCTVRKGDLLVCEGGDFGRAAIWNLDEPMRIQNHIHRLRAFSVACVKYFYYIFYLYKNTGLISGKGIGIKGLSSNALHILKVPLPPLAEQKRIVARIEELLPLCEALKHRVS